MEDKIILVDSREQKALWDCRKEGINRYKLDVGDYTTEKMLNVAHAERKNPADLASTVTSGHKRFKKEVLRSQEKGIKLAVFIECSEEDFYNRKFKGADKSKFPMETIKKIINTMSKKYDLPFIWCNGRRDMRNKILEWLDGI